MLNNKKLELLMKNYKLTFISLLSCLMISNIFASTPTSAPWYYPSSIKAYYHQIEQEYNDEAEQIQRECDEKWNRDCADKVREQEKLLIDVMHNGLHGIYDHENETSMKFAKIKNLQEDLHLQDIESAMADRCQTFLGKNYLSHIINKPLCGDSIATIVANRKQIIGEFAIKDCAVMTQPVNNETISSLTNTFSSFLYDKKSEYDAANEPKILKKAKTYIKPIGHAAMIALYAYILYRDTKDFIPKYPAYKKALPAWNSVKNIGLYAYKTFACSCAILSPCIYLIQYKNKLEKYYSGIHALAQLVERAEKIQQFYDQNNLTPEFTMNTMDNEKIQNLLIKLKDVLKFEELEKQNKNKIFAKASLCKALSDEIYELSGHLAPLFALLAEADALFSVACKMNQSSSQQISYCYSNFLVHDKPKIEAIQAWNINLATKVANSIDLDRNVIITGPNAGGKSTIIRAILQNIVLSQTLGIAAASRFNITSFDAMYRFG